MDQEKDLAGKVDALLGKHGVAPGAAGRRSADQPMFGVEDRNIPILTEVVEAPSWSPPPPPSAVQHLSEDEVDLLSHDIFSRVIDRLDGRLGPKIEQRISEQIQQQIRAAVANVMTDMRQEIANEIGDAVNAALADHLRDAQGHGTR
jgi:hypothetical protein